MLPGDQRSDTGGLPPDHQIGDSVVAMASDDVAPAKEAAAKENSGKRRPLLRRLRQKAPAKGRCQEGSGKEAAAKAPATRTGNEQPTTSRPASELPLGNST